MGEKTAISWTDHTFNPWWGCSHAGPGCEFCYAEVWAARYGFDVWGPGKPRRYFGDKHWHEPIKWNNIATVAGVRRRVFCASMADVFDNEVDQVHRERLWTLIRHTPNLDWIIVTKRIGNVMSMLPQDWMFLGRGYRNVWLLVTVCDQKEADRDIPKLLRTPAAVHGISYEPALGPLRLPFLVRGAVGYLTGGRGVKDGEPWFVDAGGTQWSAYDVEIEGINWAICGGESGPNARECEGGIEAAARSLRDQCRLTDGRIAFHMKQMGGRKRPMPPIPDDLMIREWPKQLAPELAADDPNGGATDG